MMIITKLKKLDEILDSGICAGTITDIFGFRGTGKTQMALQISLNVLKNLNFDKAIILIHKILLS